MNRIVLFLLLILAAGCQSNKEKQYTTLADVATDRIAVIMGSTQDNYVTENFPQATIVRVSVSSDLCLSLKSGKCDAFAVDEPIYEKMSRIESDICVLDSNLFNGEVGIGFGLENTAMRDEFNLMLAEMRTNGTYDEILTRWLEQDRPAMPALEMPRVGPPPCA